MFRRLCIICFLLIATAMSAQSHTIADLKVQGNKKLKSSFVKMISDVKTGTVLDSVAMDSDMIRLKRLPAVAYAYYQVFPAGENEYNVFYNIEENFTLIPNGNVYTTNDDEFAFRLGLYEFNTLGRNIAFGGFYQRDIYDSYGINLRAPFLFSNKVGLALNFQDLTTQEPVFLAQGVADYKYNNTSFEVLGLYNFNFRHRIEAGVTFFNEDYEYVQGATNPEIPQDFNVNKRLYKGIYEYDGLDYFYQYVSGFKSTFNFQYVISSDATLPDFLIGWNDFQYFVRFRESGKGNWATRLRLGVASNDESPFAPFSVDNNLNIRGVGNTIDRGTAAIVLNTEYRHTLVDKDWFILQGNLFVDAGSWRNPGGDFGDFGDDQNLRVYPGLGLRFIHKRIFNAVFRIDYGYGVTPDATSGFVFGIGQYF
ncbi:outer membrane protein assembly factor [Dokdonia sinensis]|uniref:Outer membrane protein assembly factor n=1 Tax=Dokdonia sinensis TaxID=2479847 RepID=A0A3M0GDI4_9FLAO|nr:outer membrane protein assembly factor [Dokdonia sinensis]RMB62864.1 outer membrane protein assembly factor [Dokdonia sinensis]